jgi:ATP-binding cassette, subfamily C, bacterial CydD
MEKSLFSYKGIKMVLASLAILTILQSVTIILQADFLATTISSLFRGDVFASVFKKLAIFFAALVFRHLINLLKRELSYRFAVRRGEELRNLLVQKLFHLGPRFVKEEGSGQTVTLVMEGISKFRHYLELFLPKFINTIFIPAIICIYIFFENTRSAVILVFALPILIIFMILLGLAAKTKADSQFASYQLLSNHFVDSLRGLETLKYLGLSHGHINKIKLVSEKYRNATMATLRIAFLSTFALDFFTMLSIATIAVFLGLGLINGSMELQPALTILILAPEYFLPIREVGADYHATLDGKNAGKKIQEILDKESLQIKSEPLPSYNSISNITLKGISINFTDSDQPVLDDLHFSVLGFKKIGIIGASGAGKSTLIDFLSGFLEPINGEIQIGENIISSFSYVDWQKQLTYIPQHPYLFHDTILNNIRFYHPEATVKEVEVAAYQAGLKDVIQALPHGLETIIGEGGRTLSGGQEQRIALARSFLGNRSVIMLDEPTAHLDIETEFELKNTMLNLFSNKLVFFATHRLHWMLEMDQIIVLDHGKIVEIGTHEQLMRQLGTYYQLVKTQMEGI